MVAWYLRRGVLLALPLLVPLHVRAGEVDGVVANAARSWLVDWVRQKA